MKELIDRTTIYLEPAPLFNGFDKDAYEMRMPKSVPSKKGRSPKVKKSNRAKNKVAGKSRQKNRK